jgi:hypothetical protein
LGRFRFVVGVTSVQPSASIKFKSERFDYKSDLPDEYNAGNRFYGKDLAEFLVGTLSAHGLRVDFLDEDWGWLVFSLRGESPDFEVAIYNLAEHGEGGRPGIGEWGLWIRAYEHRKILGLLPKRTAVAVPAPVSTALEAAVRSAGAEPCAWSDGPGDA